MGRPKEIEMFPLHFPNRDASLANSIKCRSESPLFAGIHRFIALGDDTGGGCGVFPFSVPGRKWHTPVGHGRVPVISPLNRAENGSDIPEASSQNAAAIHRRNQADQSEPGYSTVARLESEKTGGGCCYACLPHRVHHKRKIGMTILKSRPGAVPEKAKTQLTGMCIAHQCCTLRPQAFDNRCVLKGNKPAERSRTRFGGPSSHRYAALNCRHFAT
jgi:hypothetical protein